MRPPSEPVVLRRTLGHSREHRYGCSQAPEGRGSVAAPPKATAQLTLTATSTALGPRPVPAVGPRRRRSAGSRPTPAGPARAGAATTGSTAPARRRRPQTRVQDLRPAPLCPTARSPNRKQRRADQRLHQVVGQLVSGMRPAAAIGAKRRCHDGRCAKQTDDERVEDHHRGPARPVAQAAQHLIGEGPGARFNSKITVNPAAGQPQVQFPPSQAPDLRHQFGDPLYPALASCSLPRPVCRSSRRCKTPPPGWPPGVAHTERAANATALLAATVGMRR
jgi:hypothetical protein